MLNKNIFIDAVNDVDDDGGGGGGGDGSGRTSSGIGHAGKMERTNETMRKRVRKSGFIHFGHCLFW